MSGAYDNIEVTPENDMRTAAAAVVRGRHGRLSDSRISSTLTLNIRLRLNLLRVLEILWII